jgi:hypothetical protein
LGYYRPHGEVVLVGRTVDEMRPGTLACWRRMDLGRSPPTWQI